MMRLLVILLLLVNAALFGWQYTQSVRAATRAIVERPALPRDVPTLDLLRELDELPPEKLPVPTIPSAVESNVNEEIAAADACIDVGPFADAKARDEVAAWLQDFVAASHTRSETVRIGQFFWVYLEPTATPEAARQHLAELADSGIQDHMLISRGDLKNAISLGLFRSQDSVSRRLAELGEKGYKPVVVPRFEEAQRYYVAGQLAATAGTLNIPPALLGEAQAVAVPCAELPAQIAVLPPSEAPAAPIVEGLTD